MKKKQTIHDYITELANVSEELKEAEKALMIEGLRHFLPVIGKNDPEGLRQAFVLLEAAERNSADYWWGFRHKKLGSLAEMFMRGYTYRPIKIKWDDFLAEDVLSYSVDAAAMHR